MADQIWWNDEDDIALALADKYPDMNPREVRLRDLCTFVVGLPMFADNPNATNEEQLQRLQDAWLAEYEDRRRAA
jgi:FeS assembly protein IscX